jgi:predicted SAM-dependent methyltransferase
MVKVMNNLFDESHYLFANPDVAAAVEKNVFRSGYEHYVKHGKNEGRMPNRLSTPLRREDKVFHVLNRKGLGLEIGPSHNPIAAKKNGFNVHILDHASAAELREKYQGHNINLENIEEVDFVWKGEPFEELIGKSGCYDWVIASHVLEHVPDVVSYLQQCEALLNEDGILSLVIPDKRFCFDYFSSSSSTGSVLEAYAEKRVKPSGGQIFDHFSNASTRNGKIAWGVDELGGADHILHSVAEAKAQWIKSAATSEYIDVHCWRFTPASFRLLIQDLRYLGLIDLKIKAEFDTVGCEFYVSLTKQQDADSGMQDRLLNLEMRKIENR